MRDEVLFSFLNGLTGVYERPPEKVVQGGFTDGALMGNGDIGVTVGGDYRTVSYYIGKNDFWTDDTPLNQDGHRFNGVRPLTLGGIDLQIGRVGIAPYRMEQNIARAEVHTELTVDRGQVSVVSWVSATENLLVMDVRSDGKETLPVMVEVWCPTADAFPAERWTTLHVVNGTYPARAGIENEIGWVARETHAGEGVRWTCRAAVAVTVQGADVQMISDQDRRVFAIFNLPPGHPVRIIAAIDGGKDRTDHITGATDRIRKIDDGQVTDLHDLHQAWWHEYWMKSSVRLHDDELERYYYGALYCMACCSRAGKIAPGLMGNWLTTDWPMCHSDYHLNYNFQAPYYGLYAANRLEQIMPYYDPILAYLPEGRWRARNEIEEACPLKFPEGIRGVLYPVGLGPWGSTPDDNYHNQVSDATFAALPFIWHYEYTGDLDFLRDKAYPFMKELALFWEDYLQEDERGRLIVHAASYEGYQDINPSQDLGFIRRLFKALLDADDILQVDADLRMSRQSIIDRLSEPPTTVYENTTVFNHAETDEFLVGFTSDNLEFIHPGEQLSLGSDPEQLQIARDTIRLQDAWEQGNNIPKIFVQAVRVGYPPEDFIAPFKALMKEQFRPNLTLWEAGGGIETAGAVEMINNMLLQSHEGCIRLFPVWFSDRPASFTNLRTHGAFLVSSAFDDGQVNFVEIFSERGGTCRLLNPWPGRAFDIRRPDGSGTDVKPVEEEDLITIATEPGDALRLTPVK